MHRISSVVVSLFAFAALGAPPKPADVAKRIVESAGVGSGDVVRISGSPKDMGSERRTLMTSCVACRVGRTHTTPERRMQPTERSEEVVRRGAGIAAINPLAARGVPDASARVRPRRPA